MWERYDNDVNTLSSNAAWVARTAYKSVYMRIIIVTFATLLNINVHFHAVTDRARSYFMLHCEKIGWPEMAGLRPWRISKSGCKQKNVTTLFPVEPDAGATGPASVAGAVPAITRRGVHRP